MRRLIICPSKILQMRSLLSLIVWRETFMCRRKAPCKGERENCNFVLIWRTKSTKHDSFDTANEFWGPFTMKYFWWNKGPHACKNEWRLAGSSCHLCSLTWARGEFPPEECKGPKVWGCQADNWIWRLSVKNFQRFSNRKISQSFKTNEKPRSKTKTLQMGMIFWWRG